MRSFLITTICLAWFCIASPVKADVTIEVIDPQEGTFLVTYDLQAKYPGDAYNKTLHGFKSYDKAPGVVSIIDKNTDQKFEHDIMPSINANTLVKGEYDIMAKYNPIPRGRHYYLEFKVLLYNKEDSFVDEEGRWVFRYKTLQHNAFFILPKNHAVVYSNLPVLVYEKKGRNILQVKIKMFKELEKAPDTFSPFSEKTTLIFKTREFTNSP